MYQKANTAEFNKATKILGNCPFKVCTFQGGARGIPDPQSNQDQEDEQEEALRQQEGGGR
jgi:hypothetical protein